MATICDEASLEDTLYILRTKNLIEGNLKLLSWNNKLINDEISLTLLPGQSSTSTKYTNKNSDIILNNIKKDLMRRVNSKVENLKALITDNKKSWLT